MRVFRKLLPSERQQYCDHLLRLDTTDRHFRFGGGFGPEAIRTHCERIDWFRAVILGCFEAGVMRAAAEVRLDHHLSPHSLAPANAELGLSVEREWQGSGIGTELLNRAMIVAQNRGVRRIAMHYLAENRRMRHLARRFANTVSAEAGQIEAAIALPPPTPSSLVAEAATDGVELIAAWWDEAFRRAA